MAPRQWGLRDTSEAAARGASQQATKFWGSGWWCRLYLSSPGHAFRGTPVGDWGKWAQFYPPASSPKSSYSGWVINNKKLIPAHVRPQGASHQQMKCFRRDCPPQTLNPSSQVQVPLVPPFLPGWVTARVSHCQCWVWTRVGEGKRTAGREAAGCSHPQAFKWSLHCQPDVCFPATTPT